MLFLPAKLLLRSYLELYLLYLAWRGKRPVSQPEYNQMLQESP